MKYNRYATEFIQKNIVRKGCEMNPVHATFWTLMNVLGNGYKKMRYVRKTKKAYGTKR